MAEGATAERGLGKEELEKALADTPAEQLRDMASRLTRSIEGMQEALKDLEAESTTLREEAEYLNSTISLMMQEMQKLNIGAMNTVDPRLAEGPLDFVGRFWEKVKPRDTAYQTSEHVGEIKKPLCGDAPTPNVQQVAREVGQHVIQNAQKIPGKLGPWLQKAQGFMNEKQHELAEAAQAVAEKAKARAQQQQQQQRGAGGYPAGGGGAAASAATPAASSGAGLGLGKSASPKKAPSADAAAAPAAATAAPAAAAAEPEAAPEAVQGDAKEASPSAGGAAAEEAAAQPGGEGGEGVEEHDQTILIEAKLKVDDGNILTLKVGASDRSKEVAQRFVQEHSLKAWFQDPLTAWLKEIENDAEKFPVLIEADLMQIRKDFSKKK